MIMKHVVFSVLNNNELVLRLKIFFVINMNVFKLSGISVISTRVMGRFPVFRNV